MIQDWRAQWGQGDFPFIIQQLVNNGAPPKGANQPASWAYLREAQRQVADTVPACGLATGIELGDSRTIHPKNKQEVGERLARVALEKAYGQKIESSGPRFEAAAIEGSAIRVKFTHADGLNARGRDPQRFAIAGENKQFVWAAAKVEGNTVVVSSPEVTKPVAVRYAGPRTRTVPIFITPPDFPPRLFGAMTGSKSIPPFGVSRFNRCKGCSPPCP